MSVVDNGIPNAVEDDVWHYWKRWEEINHRAILLLVDEVEIQMREGCKQKVDMYRYISHPDSCLRFSLTIPVCLS